MSTITSSYSISSILIEIDRIGDYLPIASTVINLIDLFEKCVLKAYSQSAFVKTNRYFSYISDKSSLRCVVLLVPVLGNIAVGIHDLIQKRIGENEEREALASQAQMLGLNPNQLPHSVLERRRIIENTRQEKLQAVTHQVLNAYDAQIAHIRHFIEPFKRLIDDPQEEIKMVGLFGIPLEVHTETHLEKINCVWSNFKLIMALQNLGECFQRLGRLHENQRIVQKQGECSELNKQVIQLRQAFYRAHIQNINEAELLKEAKIYYLGSFLKQERERLQESVEQMTLAALLPKLKERVRAPNIAEYDCIEMQEISARMNALALHT
ncbi:hypothetical protein [Candidatus Protochlamydia phocaeensis]|uniref:hypothetical protein n=1 Tax=Candidatus Protochlamydia phocaeensis TaxID=1414722 RepID=UPI000838F932|nr:hypothetical protein [Candidatus Protochlamydia phocaeensis]